MNLNTSETETAPQQAAYDNCAHDRQK